MTSEKCPLVMLLVILMELQASVKKNVPTLQSATMTTTTFSSHGKYCITVAESVRASAKCLEGTL